MRARPVIGLLGLLMMVTGSVLSGCTTILTETAKKALEDRSTEDQVTDTKIATGILSRLAGKDKGLLLDVSVDVWEQRVLLTGTLSDPSVREDVVQLVRQDDRIKALYDEIQIVPPEVQEERRDLKKAHQEGASEEKSGMQQAVDDFWIASKIQGQLLAKKGITSVNYRWRSVRNQVYIIGRARSQQELETVLEIIRDTKGVDGVKQFVEIKPVS